LFLSASESVGDGIEESGGSHALALVVDDDGGGIPAMSVVADLYFFVP
jgi:hypothetical protein